MGFASNPYFIVGSLLATIVATILVSRYYFLKSLDTKRLGVRILSSNRVVYQHSNVKDALEIKFRGEEIDELYQAKIMVGNCGTREIEGAKCKLNIEIHDEMGIADTTMHSVCPPERFAAFKESQDSENENLVINVDFNFLNKNEYFIANLLTTRQLTKKNVSFNVDCPGLPPKLSHNFLKIEWLVQKANRPTWKERTGKTLGFFLLSLLAISSVLGGKEILSLTTVTFSNFQAQWISAISFSIVLAVMFAQALLWGLLALALLLDGATKWNIFGATRPCFELPEEVGILAKGNLKEFPLLDP